jgi:hypothetical protein
MRYRFASELRRWEARVRDDWYFVELPDDASAEIHEWADALPRSGFGAVKVAAQVGDTGRRRAGHDPARGDERDRRAVGHPMLTRLRPHGPIGNVQHEQAGSGRGHALFSNICSNESTRQPTSSTSASTTSCRRRAPRP